MMQAISSEHSSFTAAASVSLMTFAAIALLGLVLAYWTWIWFAPSPVPRVQSPADPARGVATASSLFGSVQRGRNIAAPTGIAIRLLGVVAASGGRRGYAVVQLEAKQTLAVLEGDDIVPGIRLVSVNADHVILERGGTRETLTWPEQKTPVKPAAPRINK